MTRIVHVTDCYLPRLGGIEMHVHDLARHQRATGHDALVVTTTAPDGTTEDPGWVRRFGGNGPWATRWLDAEPDLVRMLEQVAPDAVHVHVSVYSPFATLAAWRAARLGLPTLVTIHSMWSGLGPLPGIARAVMRLREWPIHWSAVSDRAAEPLRTMLGPDVPVDVLPNAVDPLAWRVEPVETDVPTILAVGRLARTKRPLPLARMLRDLHRRVGDDVPFRAVLIGDGPQRPRLEGYLHRHQMADWVDLPGRVDRATIRHALARADLFVAPAELESFGIAALEARCAGVPVVASSRSGVGEFITSGIEGVLAPDDGEMVTAMADLLTDPGRRAAMAAYNRTVVPDVGWETAAGRTLELYARAADQARAPHLNRAGSLRLPVGVEQ